MSENAAEAVLRASGAPLSVNFYGMAICVPTGDPHEAYLRLCKVLEKAKFEYITDGFEIGTSAGAFDDQGTTEALFDREGVQVRARIKSRKAVALGAQTTIAEALEQVLTEKFQVGVDVEWEQGDQFLIGMHKSTSEWRACRTVERAAKLFGWECTTEVVRD